MKNVPFALIPTSPGLRWQGWNAGADFITAALLSGFSIAVLGLAQHTSTTALVHSNGGYSHVATTVIAIFDAIVNNSHGKPTTGWLSAVHAPRLVSHSEVQLCWLFSLVLLFDFSCSLETTPLQHRLDHSLSAFWGSFMWFHLHSAFIGVIVFVASFAAQRGSFLLFLDFIYPTYTG